jgi:hypothetical protein
MAAAMMMGRVESVGLVEAEKTLEVEAGEEEVEVGVGAWE